MRPRGGVVLPAMDEARDEGDERPGRALRIARAFGLVPTLLLCAWTLPGPPAPATFAFSVAVAVATVGAFRPKGADRRLLLGLAAVGALVVLVIRVSVAGDGRTVTNGSLPGDGEGGGRFIDRLVPERDVAIGGSRLLLVTGLMPEDEPGLLDHLDDGYRRMREAEGAVPSPVVGTFLFGQSPDDFGLLRVAPTGPRRPEAAVLFLHGFIGSVSLLCWQVGQAAGPVGLETVCPAMDWRARWDSPDGRAVVRATLRDLRARGVRRVYLAGLSAGAIGASRLAEDLDVRGVVLLSGASPEATPRAVPTLVLQGARDRMTPPAPARRYAQALGARARYVEVEDAGHWLVLSHHEAVRAEIEAFLRRAEGLPAVPEPG